MLGLYVRNGGLQYRYLLEVSETKATILGTWDCHMGGLLEVPTVAQT